MRIHRRLLPVLAVLLPAALLCQTGQASAATAALTMELRSDTAHSASYKYSPGTLGDPGSYVATVEGTVNGTTIDPTTCDASVGAGDVTGGSTGATSASATDCAGMTIRADVSPGSQRAMVTVYSSDGTAIAEGAGTVSVTTEYGDPGPDGFIIIIIIIIIIILVLWPKDAH